MGDSYSFVRILSTIFSLIKQIRHFSDHIVIDVPITGECLGAFAMSREFADEVRVFDFLVEVADEGAACHVGAGDVADGVLFGLFGDGIDGGDDSGDAGSFEGDADEVVEFAGGHIWEECVFRLAFVAVHYLDGGGSEVDFDDSRTFFFGLARYVLDGCAVFGGDDVVRCEGEEVADAAANVALEYEYVACEGYFVVSSEVGFEYGVSFFCCEVVRGSEFLGTYRIFTEGVVFRVAHIDAPSPIGSDGTHIGDDGIVAAFKRCAFVLGVFPDIFVFPYGFEDSAVFFFFWLEEFVFVAEEVLDGEQCFVV